MNKKADKLNSLFNIAQYVEPTTTQKVRLAAGVFVRDRLISTGFAHAKTHPFAARFSKTQTNPRQNVFVKDEDSFCFHAEVHSIHNAIKRIGEDALRAAGATLYVARAKRASANAKGFVWGCSKPCSGCIRAAKEYNIKEVVYTEDENHYGNRIVCTMEIV